jgi:outer membrane protein OmpA-like peptidoglycan-associated protein
MRPSRYQGGGASLGRGFDVADETLDRPAGFNLDDDIDDDFEDNLEAEALTKGFGGIGATGLDVTVLVAFSSQGFNTTPQFRKTWIVLLRANRVKSSVGFRADFCKARHFRAKLKGAGIKAFAVVRGFPMAYSLSASGKVILEGIGSPTFITQLARSGQRMAPPLPCPQPPIRLPKPRHYSLTVYFSPPGSANVKASEQQKLFDWYSGLPPSVQAKIKQGRPTIVLEGFASTTQPAPANKRLSERRAVQVRNALMAIIGPGAKYMLYPWGESKAKTPDEVEDPKERRVRVSVTDPS